MRYLTTCPITFMGSRVEKGAFIDTTPEDAARYGGDLVPAPEEAPVVEAEPEPEVAVADMNLKQLQAKAKELGLSDKGSKADLLERINLHSDDED